MGGWVQAIVVVVINLLTAAFLAGTVFRGNKEHERRLEILEAGHMDQWTAIGNIRVDVGKVKQKVGMEDW